ncbi:MAG TPA: TetR/AcrR family transcriptional regulator C-terminal domain-containing protein [Chloroflexota bacterium]
MRDLGRAHPNLCDAGLELSTAFVAFVTLKSYVAGHTEWTIADGGMGSREGQICDALPEFNARAYPRLATVAQELGQEHIAAEFERGLDLIIDGIRARLRTTNHEPRTTNHEPRTTNHEPLKH